MMTMKMMTRREDSATMTAMIAMSSDGLSSAGAQRDNSENKDYNRIFNFHNIFFAFNLKVKLCSWIIVLVRV